MQKFDPLDFGFIEVADPFNTLHFYEYNSGKFCDGTVDPHHLNVYLTQDGDFVTIWHGLFDPAFIDQSFHDLLERAGQQHFDFTANYHTQFFRGYIETKEQAEVILPSLRYQNMVPSFIYIDKDQRIACEAIPTGEDQSP